MMSILDKPTCSILPNHPVSSGLGRVIDQDRAGLQPLGSGKPEIPKGQVHVVPSLEGAAIPGPAVGSWLTFASAPPGLLWIGQERGLTGLVVILGCPPRAPPGPGAAHLSTPWILVATLIGQVALSILLWGLAVGAGCTRAGPDQVTGSPALCQARP